jgi:AcrR family transcriptional regulator
MTTTDEEQSGRRQGAGSRGAGSTGAGSRGAGSRGAGTRAAAQRVALELFTSQGYASTSLREIAERLGINKASLYHHFASKEDILRSLFSERGAEAEDLLAWLSEQPADPGLVRTAVLRWVDSFTADKLRGIRFLGANPLVARTFDADGDRIGDGLNQLVDRLVPLLPSPSGADVVLLRMALLSINAAVQAAAQSGVADEDVVVAARRAADALLQQLPGALVDDPVAPAPVTGPS